MPPPYSQALLKRRTASVGWIYAQSDKAASNVSAFLQNFTDATLIHTEGLCDVMLLLAEEVAFPHLDGVVESERWARSAKRAGREVGVWDRHHGHSGSERRLLGCSPSASVL